MVNEIKQDRNSLEEVKKRIEEVIAQVPELEKLKNQVLMEITDDGLRIELLERENSHFFDIGSANVKPETQKILGLIATELGRLPNKVTIEGHTDSRPYGNQNYTNWELSADRANAARRLMVPSGLRPDQVFAVRGFADRQLRNRQDPLDFQNRRVSIIVNFQDPKDRELLKNLKPNGTKASSLSEAGPSVKPPQALELPKPVKPPAQMEPAEPPAEPPPPTGQNPDDDAAQGLLGKNPLGEEINRQLKPMLPKIREGW